MSFNFTIYGDWSIYWGKVFVIFKDCLKTEGDPPLILLTKIPTKCPTAPCSKATIKRPALFEQHVQT